MISSTKNHPAMSRRVIGAQRREATYKEKWSQRVFLAMYHSPNRQAKRIVMADPEYRWERNPALDCLTLFSDIPGSVRSNAFMMLKQKTKDDKKPKKRDLHKEKVLQTKNLVARRLMAEFGEDRVQLNNGKSPFVHLHSPIIVNFKSGHLLFVNFHLSNPGRGRRPDQSEEFDKDNEYHSMINILIHDDINSGTHAIDASWSLGPTLPDEAFAVQDEIFDFTTRCISSPLEMCREFYGDVRLGRPEERQSRKVQFKTEPVKTDAEPTQEAEDMESDEVLDLGKINLSNPSQADLEKIKKLQEVFGGIDGKKSKRLSREEYIAKKKQAQTEKWESTELYAKFHGTPLGEIAARNNHSFGYNEDDAELRSMNHDRGILANVEHWHTLAIRALHDLKFKSGEVIEIDEVLDYIADGLAEVDPNASDIKVGDNYQTRFFSVLAFYIANARDLGLDLKYNVASIEKIQGKKVVKSAGHHFAVAPAMGDESAVVDLIAQGNYGQKQ